MALSAVVLPAPFGPITLVIAPARASKLKFLTARTPPKLMARLRTEIPLPVTPDARNAATSRRCAERALATWLGQKCRAITPTSTGRREPKHDQHQHADKEKPILSERRQEFRQQTTTHAPTKGRTAGRCRRA